ncbi:MAG: nitrile hydratase subunit beta [Alphaproteobacteria bacterium]|nr:nitrile hydratase subunit beta [Alphaproteobacteria bacterium]
MSGKQQNYRNNAGGRTVHDVGGLDFGAVDMDEHDLALWERRVDAMIVLLATDKAAFTVDGMRRVIESYGEQQYDNTTYYEKWCRALRNLLVEQDVVSQEELAQKVAEARATMRAAGRDVSDEDVPWNEGIWTGEADRT